jgi:coproporphyrinogen III oxidase-like Fe-S oxidoreductase
MDRVLALPDDTLRDTLRGMCMEGIVEQQTNWLVVTEAGRPFIRNICAAFDARLRAKDAFRQNVFSKSI